MRDAPIEKENAGPPSNAVNSRPNRRNVAPINFPFGIGPSLSLLLSLTIFEFGKTET